MPTRYPAKLNFQVVLELPQGDKAPGQVARAYASISIRPAEYGVLSTALWLKERYGRVVNPKWCDGGINNGTRLCYELPGYRSHIPFDR
jgi:hypothetical protein